MHNLANGCGAAFNRYTGNQWVGFEAQLGAMYGPKAVSEQPLAEEFMDRLPAGAVLVGEAMRRLTPLNRRKFA
jgi:hypothetical protein